MSPTKRTKQLVVRLLEADKRRFKSLAAAQGMSLQDVVHQALLAWEAQLQPKATPAPGPRAQANAKAGKPGAQPEAAPRTANRRRAAPATPASRPVAGHDRDSEDRPSAWLRAAAGLDWSQCEAVEMAQDKAGPIWVFRGTRIPLAHAFRDLDSGLAFGEILERHHGLTREALKAVLQFVAEGFVLQGSKQ